MKIHKTHLEEGWNCILPQLKRKLKNVDLSSYKEEYFEYLQECCDLLDLPMEEWYILTEDSRWFFAMYKEIMAKDAILEFLKKSLYYAEMIDTCYILISVLMFIFLCFQVNLSGALLFLIVSEIGYKCGPWMGNIKKGNRYE